MKRILRLYLHAINLHFLCYYLTLRYNFRKVKIIHQLIRGERQRYQFSYLKLSCSIMFKMSFYFLCNIYYSLKAFSKSKNVCTVKILGCYREYRVNARCASTRYITVTNESSRNSRDRKVKVFESWLHLITLEVFVYLLLTTTSYRKNNYFILSCSIYDIYCWCARQFFSIFLAFFLVFRSLFMLLGKKIVSFRAKH